MPELTLIDGGLELCVNVLNRVFEGNHVNRLRLINLIEQRGQRGCLSAAGGAGHQNEAGFFLGDLVKDGREMKCFNSWDFSLKFPKHDREMSLLPENIDAETGFIVKRVTAIARASSQVIVNQPAISLHEREGNLLRLIGSKCFNRRIDKNRF